jgi:DNA recombination protein RmuC
MPFSVSVIILIVPLVAALVVSLTLLARRGKELRDAAAAQAADRVRIESLTEQIEADRRRLGEVQEAFRAEFRVLANSIFEEKTSQFKQANKESLELLLNPFKQNISDFRERIEKIYSEENSQRSSLKGEIKSLVEQTVRITAETTALTRALRGDSKTQGDWGEMILETMLETSGLQKGIHYTVQENLKDETGANLRPDVILRLPDDKRLVIDSKVSLTAFVNFTACEEQTPRAAHLEAHLQSVRSHIRSLGAKGYQDLLSSPDFVIMFIPNEPAFLAAMHADAELWNDAYARKVILSSPANLFAILKIVHDLWRREDQSRNARDIAEAGSRLYDKLVGLYETLLDIGRNLDNTQKSYDKALGQLRDGKGSLISRTENLRKLGVKAGKRLPAALAADSEDGGDEQ